MKKFQTLLLIIGCIVALGIVVSYVLHTLDQLNVTAAILMVLTTCSAIADSISIYTYLFT